VPPITVQRATPVIVSGDSHGTVRVWQLTDGTPIGEPLRGHNYSVEAVAVGARPDSPGHRQRRRGPHGMGVRQLADGTPLASAIQR
jgi:hypothetical protein